MGVLKWRKLVLPPIKGRSDQTSRYIAPPDEFIITNGYFAKDGEVVKRNGFLPLTNVVEDLNEVGYSSSVLSTEGNVRSIFATDGELCVAAWRQLFAYQNSSLGWKNRGWISPFSMKARNILASDGDYVSIDSDRSQGFSVSVGVRIGQIIQNDGDRVYQSTAEVVSEIISGSLVSSFTLLTSVGNAEISNNMPVAAHVAGSSNFFGILLSVAAGGAGNKLRLYRYSTNSPATDPVIAFTVTTALLAAGGTKGHFRPFDIKKVGSKFVVVYLDTSGLLTVERYDQGITSLEASATPDPSSRFEDVAMCADHTDGNKFWLIVYRSDFNVQIMSINLTTLAIVHGPTTIHTQVETITSLGIRTGASPNGDRVACVWGDLQGTSADAGDPLNWQYPTTHRTLSRSTGMNTADADTLHIAPNSMPIAQPYWNGKRCFVPVSIMMTGNYLRDITGPQLNGYEYWLWLKDSGNGGFCSSAVVDLDMRAVAAGPPARNPKIVGAFNVGLTAHRDSAGFGEGSLNFPGVYNDTSGRWIFFGSLSNSYASGLSTDEKFYFPSTSARVLHPAFIFRQFDIMEMDFAYRTQAVAIGDGAAMIGGGAVMFYDGERTAEHGFLVPPWIYNFHHTSFDVLQAQNFGFCQFIWKHNRRHWKTRSLPCAPGWNPGMNPGDVSSARAGSYPYGHRPEINAVCYWAGSPTNNVPLRVSGDVVHFIQDGPVIIEAVTRNGVPSASTKKVAFTVPPAEQELLYTAPGELENVSPDGAASLALSGRRVFLLGMVRGNRFQYSKPIVPTVDSGLNQSPEFNEGFGFHSDDDSDTVAASRHNDGTLVWTSKEIYYLQGHGPDERGLGDDFSGTSPLSSDFGCISAASVVNFSDGTFFQSVPGIYMVTSGLDVVFVGQMVKDLTDVYSTITSAVVVPEYTQVRFTCHNSTKTAGIVLVYDYRIKQWSHWTFETFVPVGGAYLNGVYYLLASVGKVYQETPGTSFDEEGGRSGKFVEMNIRMGWAQTPQAHMRLRKVSALNSFADFHNLDVSVFRDFDESNPDIKSYTDTEISGFDDPLNKQEYQCRPTRQKGTSFMVEVKDSVSVLSTTGRGYRFHGFVLEYGVKGGLDKLPDVEKK